MFLRLTFKFQVWSCYSVLNVLYSLIQKSKINEHLVAIQEGKSAEDIAYVRPYWFYMMFSHYLSMQ